MPHVQEVEHPVGDGTLVIEGEPTHAPAHIGDRAVVNLQHDGVLLQLRPYDDKPYVETALTSLCSAALGYPQPVSHKPWPGSGPKA